MKKLLTVMAAALSVFGATGASGQVNLIAKGTLTESSAGLYADLSGLDYNLENGAPANLLGGLGSGSLGDMATRSCARSWAERGEF